MSGRIRIPQDDGAPMEAKSELVEFAALFGEDALDQRLQLLHEAASRCHGLPIPDSEIGRKVRRSLTWGTAAEVALRLLGPRLDPDLLARVDAATVSVRIARGLAERPWKQDALIFALTSIAEDLLPATAVSPELLSRHQSSLALLESHRNDPAIWSKDEVRAFAESTPIAFAMEAACAVSDCAPSEHWGTRLAVHYGVCHLLSLDLKVLCDEPHTTSDLTSPTRDALRVADTEPSRRDANIQLCVDTCLPVLEFHAEQLQHEIQLGVESNQPTLAVDYARSALTAAALVFQAVAKLGYV